MPDSDGNPTEAEAIRQVIAEGARGDYADVAASVKQRFGLIVGARLVEEVVKELRRNTPERQPADVAHRDAESSRKSADRRSRVLEFVQDMGGFDEARAAIDELESDVKRLTR